MAGEERRGVTEEKRLQQRVKIMSWDRFLRIYLKQNRSDDVARDYYGNTYIFNVTLNEVFLHEVNKAIKLVLVW